MDRYQILAERLEKHSQAPAAQPPRKARRQPPTLTQIILIAMIYGAIAATILIFWK